MCGSHVTKLHLVDLEGDGVSLRLTTQIEAHIETCILNDIVYDIVVSIAKREKVAWQPLF